MYIYGSSLRSYLLAAVVPSKSESHALTSLCIVLVLHVHCWTLSPLKYRGWCNELFRQAWLFELNTHSHKWLHILCDAFADLAVVLGNSLHTQ